MKTVYILLIFSLACCTIGIAQDLHFSQYYNNPLLINPANTGFNPDYDYRMGGSYRNQWTSVIANPYKTISLWGDAQLFNPHVETGWFGIGGCLYKDEAGSANLQSTKGYLSLAYHQMLGLSSLLSFGVNGGAINKRIDKTKLIFDNQWNGQFFDTHSQIDGGETFTNTNTTYLDVQAGINYAWFISETAYLNVGISAMHLNKPSETFFASTNNSDNKIPIRYTYFVNANYKIPDLWILNPNFYISTSAGTTETVIGINANRDLSGDGAQQLILGLYYRNKDALIPTIGYQLNDLKLTVNYDVTTSALATINGYQGGYELSIIKSGVYNNGQHPIKCPSLKF